MMAMIDQQIRQRMDQAQSIGIVAHIRPDGDAIGGLLGLGMALQEAGKSVEMVLRDGVSATFRHLPGSDQIKKQFENRNDLVIVLDCSDLLRTGGVLEGRIPDINIDHHITNEQFASINLVEPDSVATSAILTAHMGSWNLPITQEVAKALLTGILSDSIGFRTSNTTAESLRLAACLMDHGANISELYNKALISRSFEATHYWGYGLSHIEQQNGLVWTSLTLEDRKNAGYPGNDDADLTNILSSIDPLDIAVLFIEQKPDLIKVSWRARPGLDVATLAHSLGGGGHPAAAGADVKGNLPDVQKMILELTQKYLNEVKTCAINNIEGGQ